MVNVIAHNAAFELAFLEHAGVALGEMHCTLQACRLTLGEHASGLDDAAAYYFGFKLDKALQTSDWNALALSREQIEYAVIDAVIAWRLAETILPRLEVQKLAYEIQMRAVPAVVRMEARGFKLDRGAHAQLIADLTQEHLEAADEYREACRAGGHEGLASAIPTTAAQKAIAAADPLDRGRVSLIGRKQRNPGPRAPGASTSRALPITCRSGR